MHTRLDAISKTIPVFLACTGHTWQLNRRWWLVRGWGWGGSFFSISLCPCMSRRPKWDYCNPAWPQSRGNPNGVYFIPSLFYFYPFLSFPFFWIFSFIHPLYFALLPTLLPLFHLKDFQIFNKKHQMSPNCLNWGYKHIKKCSAVGYEGQKGLHRMPVWRLWFLMYRSLFLCVDGIVQKDDTPLYAAEIGSELQKQFAILPGWFDFSLLKVIMLKSTQHFESAHWFQSNETVWHRQMTELVFKSRMNEWPRIVLGIFPDVQHGLDQTGQLSC